MVTIHGNVVHFSFFCPGARRVRLVGGPPRSALRHWDMVPTAEGFWLSQLRLPRGTFWFRYRADRRWHIDPDEVGDRDRRTGWFSVIDVAGSEPGREPLALAAAPQRPSWRAVTSRRRADG